MNQPQLLQSDPLFQEVLKPILYTDIFDYPLTFDEIYRFLQVEVPSQSVKELLSQAVAAGQLTLADGFYSLPNRHDLAAKRQARVPISADLWRRATYYGRWIATMPFVRFVAVTGSLAVNNPRNRMDDIDYLIVTQPGRLWLCRAMIILLVKFGLRRGVHLCPNYLLTERVLDFDADFFVAREMLQMQPLYGRALYLDLRSRNDWVNQYFPQATHLNLDHVDDQLWWGARLFKQAGQAVLGTPLGGWLERWLQGIQITKHTKRAEQYGVRDKVIFTPDVCKGHFDGHNSKTMDAYQKRVDSHLNVDRSVSRNGTGRDHHNFKDG